ncbi:polysaccharide deacetylase family protein [Noviherbaspirillum cavernae]|nr:polysaccharide deacetylase family protein [Noviherbaspirillum cavernae]
MKRLLGALSYRLGVLSLYHRFRNRNQLTVAMFHRVLPPSDPRYQGADPERTMTPDSFAHCLSFFRRHYRIVSPAQVFSALKEGAPLPRHSLLVTFDNGWADTAEYAQPLMEKFSISGLVFVAGGAINMRLPFWEAHAYSYLATHPEGRAVVEAALAPYGIRLAPPPSQEMDELHIRSIIRQLGTLEPPVRAAIVGAMALAEDIPAAMLDADKLTHLAALSHCIGGHGFTHRPLTVVANLEEELEKSQEAIAAHLDGRPAEAMSFPQGAYSDSVIAGCLSAGYRYLFSSDACLNAVNKRFNHARPLGRIHISERAIVDQTGRVQPAMLATWLFTRPLGDSRRKNRLRKA